MDEGNLGIVPGRSLPREASFKSGRKPVSAQSYILRVPESIPKKKHKKREQARLSNPKRRKSIVLTPSGLGPNNPLGTSKHLSTYHRSKDHLSRYILSYGHTNV